MAFGGFERGSSPAHPMAEINVTPLVDVMLVLLVIFIITAPLLTAAVKIDLPEEAAPPAGASTTAIRITIDADGALYWEADKVDDAALSERLAAAAKRRPVPELHLHADRQARYARLAHVMAAAQQAGLTRMGFVTEPPGAGAADAPGAAAR
jgi:biopolymer transport protein ExbD